MVLIRRTQDEWTPALPTGYGIHVLAANRLFDDDDTVSLQHRREVVDWTAPKAPVIPNAGGDPLQLFRRPKSEIPLGARQVHPRQFDEPLDIVHHVPSPF